MKEQNLDLAFEKVKGLVTKFKQGEKHYLSQSYQEAEVRQDFLDDFFTALGWDVGHKIQHDPYEQEVKVEKGVKVSGAQKRADYSFTLAPNFRDPKFFAEAKKPSKELKNAQDYFQSIRYGWHKQHPFSILTDFEEFHILDCRYTPDINNSLDKCYKRFHYTDYLIKEKFAEIYFLFSREAVANNSIEKVAETLPKRKGKATTKTPFPLEIHQTIDEAFLEVIDGIREKLAKAFKKQDENLTSEELTEATQRTVDRLVFIRFLEDKLIEQEHWVSEFGEKGSVWNDFISACRKLDAKYNGIVFKEHFIDLQNFAGADENEFRIICQDICHLNSRFLFNEIPIHILGSIYERFLGKVVHATAKRVTVEEKLEVQKAGGVYYTPKYIVDYIVRNTVGKLIEGKTPKQIAKLRFADIACGSGSFLIGVFDCLLDYHNKYYQKHPDKAKKDKCIEKDGLWVLSIKQKQKILINNIYGVDIDQQATEVTQLSLALKMLEDETTATANEMQVLFHEKILPNMSKNIICGNSLIGTDILTQNLFAGDEERKLNPMDFEDVFKDIMRNGGFDAIVGNPPYVDSRINESEIKDYWKTHYASSQFGKTNTYEIFIEKGLKILKKEGKLGFIVPVVLLNLEACKGLRALLIRNYFIEEIAYGDFAVFENANVDTITILISNNKSPKNKEVEILKLSENFEKIINRHSFGIDEASELNDYKISLKSDPITKRLSLQKGKYIKISAVVDFYNGIATGPDKEKYFSFKKLNNKYKPLLMGNNIGHYNIHYDGRYIMYERGKLHRPRDEKIFLSKEKIIMQRIRNLKLERRLVCTLDTKQFYTFNSVNNLLLKETTHYNLRYVLALLNSNLLNYLLKQFSLNTNITLSDLELLPIRSINFQNKTEKSAHDKIVSLVEQMLQAKKEIKSTKTDKDKNYSVRKCSSLDTAIDTEVYKLYALTDEEIKIVEGIKPKQNS